MKRVINFIFIALIRVYQRTISPFFPSTCRYAPSCSQYAVGAFKEYGTGRAMLLTVKRVFSCHPWGGSGFDPVPEKKKQT